MRRSITRTAVFRCAARRHGDRVGGFQLLCNKHVSFTFTSPSVCALKSCLLAPRRFLTLQLLTLIRRSPLFLALRAFNPKQVQDHLSFLQTYPLPISGCSATPHQFPVPQQLPKTPSSPYRTLSHTHTRPNTTLHVQSSPIIWWNSYFWLVIQRPLGSENLLGSTSQTLISGWPHLRTLHFDFEPISNNKHCRLTSLNRLLIHRNHQRPRTRKRTSSQLTSVHHPPWCKTPTFGAASPSPYTTTKPRSSPQTQKASRKVRGKQQSMRTSCPSQLP